MTASKDITGHRHVITKVDGNKMLCKCGASMGFVRPPKKKVQE
jgi:CDGSH-type Zn-finger protein